MKNKSQLLSAVLTEFAGSIVSTDPRRNASLYSEDNLFRNLNNTFTAEDIIKKTEQTPIEAKHRLDLAEQKRARKNAKRLANK